MTLQFACTSSPCPGSCTFRVSGCTTNGACCGEPTPVYGISDGGALIVSFCTNPSNDPLGSLPCDGVTPLYFGATGADCDILQADLGVVLFGCIKTL